MKLDLEKPVQTRDGRKARVICTDMKHEKGPIIAIIETSEGFEKVQQYWEGGYYNNNYHDDRIDSGNDLINIPEEKELWLNVYDENKRVPFATLRVSKKDADEFADKDRIARIKVTYKEGQFDDD